jgi:hypothetical protein
MRTVLIEADATLAGTRGITERMLGDGWIVNPDQVRFSRDGLRPAKPVMAEIAGHVHGEHRLWTRGSMTAFAYRGASDVSHPNSRHDLSARGSAQRERSDHFLVLRRKETFGDYAMQYGEALAEH